jgi:1,4-dihydroxy-2-naphthoate octaprenyltransferase
MLANNICDIEDDLENRRYTLPIYIGKERALWVFKTLYYISYVDIILLLVLGVAPATTAITIFTLVQVRRNLKTFDEKQTKKETFALAVQNFLIMNVVQLLAFGGAMIIILLTSL